MKLEKDIRKIIQYSEKHPLEKNIRPEDAGITLMSARMMEGLGYVKDIWTDMSGENTTFAASPACLSYFLVKKQRRADFWKKVFTNFFVGFLSGAAVTFVTVYLIPLLTA